MPQLWPIRRGIDQLILRLGRAQAMIINLLIIIGRLEGFSALWFCEARIEKTLVLTVPGEVRKFDPADFVGKHLSAFNIDDVQNAPVSSSILYGIAQMIPVRRVLPFGERRGTIGGKAVWITEKGGFSPQTSPNK